MVRVQVRSNEGMGKVSAGDGEEGWREKERFQKKNCCGKLGEANPRVLAAEFTTQAHTSRG